MAQDNVSSFFGRLQVADEVDKLVIGLDFGTTYSGVAYTFTGTEKPAAHLIYDWPGARGRRLQKVPTTLQYLPQEPGKDGKSFLWGYEIDEYGTDKIEGIKLLLDPDMPRPLYVPPTDTKAELEKLGKPVIDAVADYIGAIYKHAISQVEGAYPKEFVAMHPKKLVLSVPAVWSDKAKDATQRAARKAGIQDIDLITEPEAAALCTFHELKAKALTVGDAFVLVDAGGGTVDLISYEVAQVSPLQLRECVPGNGGLAGSLMLNKRFSETIEQAVGKEQFVSLRKTESFRLAMQQFDQHIKTSFNPFDKQHKPDKQIFVPFPMAGLKDDPARNIKSDCYTLTQQTLETLFAPLIKEIEGLVKDQISSLKIARMEQQKPNASDVKAIFLVGGFGSSNYLRECLQQSYPNIQVIQPNDAWSAIVRGTVLSKLPQEAEITATIAKRHYGVCAWAHAEPDDMNEVTEWDSFDEVWRVRKMQWYIYQGDDLERDKKIKFPFQRKVKIDYTAEDVKFVDRMIQSEAINPAKYPREGITTTNCTVTSDFSKVPSSEFHRGTNSDGISFFEIRYDLAIATNTASFIFSAEIDGKAIGSVEADYQAKGTTDFDLHQAE